MELRQKLQQRAGDPAALGFRLFLFCCVYDWGDLSAFKELGCNWKEETWKIYQLGTFGPRPGVRLKGMGQLPEGH